jgi:hypothetical protein
LIAKNSKREFKIKNGRKRLMNKSKLARNQISKLLN